MNRTEIFQTYWNYFHEIAKAGWCFWYQRARSGGAGAGNGLWLCIFFLGPMLNLLADPWYIVVMNLVPTHSNCTSPMDYISHHALHSHIPVHHYTNHTAVTIHSSLWLPHHTCTSFSHSHKSSTQTLTQCEVLFSPGYISERSPIHPAISVWPRTARPWNSEPVPVTSTSAWYCLRLCFASDIPVMPADHCLCDSAAV